MSGGNWKEMFEAIKHGDIELINYHLKMGIDPNYQHPEYLAAPLIESVRLNQIAIAKLFLENGAKAEIKEVMTGDTALSVAKENKNKEAETLILEYLS